MQSIKPVKMTRSKPLKSTFNNSNDLLVNHYQQSKKERKKVLKTARINKQALINNWGL